MDSAELTELIRVARGLSPANAWIRNAAVLNVYTGEVSEAHVVVSGKRIAYVGDRDPMVDERTVVLDAAGQTLVPGYFEPHAHSCLMYNPQTFAAYSVARGTTAVLQDNMPFFLNLEQTEMERVFEVLSRLPVKSYWWCRLDPQMGNSDEMKKFTPDRIRRTMDHPSVLQAGELTGWKMLFDLDPGMVERVAIARASGKRIETHNPGASIHTLNVMAAGGATACHESISAEDVWARVRLGYYAALRHSSIRPDLPHLIRGLLDTGFTAWDRLMFTTDGASPFFLSAGTLDLCVSIAIEQGLPPAAAYRMASLNPAIYYGLDADLGGIAPGRIADILFLEDLRHPTPRRVMVDGHIVAEDGQLTVPQPSVDWAALGVRSLAVTDRAVKPDWFDVQAGPDGNVPVIELRNAVITRLVEEPLPVQDGRVVLADCPGCLYAAVIDRMGAWGTTAVLRGFGDFDAVASSHALTGDFVVVGRNQTEMARALQRVIEIGGGICLRNQGDCVFEMAMPMFQTMSLEPMDALMDAARRFDEQMRAFGYAHEDPVYTLLFLSATHLPAVRLTERGLYEVKTDRVLAPARSLS